MAVSGIQPFVKVLDSNGVPIVGAKLHVYEAGTTSYRAIYSDESLSVSLSNPLTGANASNASGDFPRFYQNSGTYKLRAETSAGVLIWEYDNIDTGISAGAGALPIASGGTGGTTAAAARTNLDVPSNSELQDLSDQIATFSISLQSITAQPGGRLTLTTAIPVLTSGVSAATSVFYTPYSSTLCPIYDGTQFNLETFAELTLTLVASHTASTIYDVFIFKDTGVVTVGTGPAWTTSTAGAGARGTGGGTTELTRLRGILVNANSITARNGSTTYTVAANKGTYVGSLFMDGTNGQISCHTAYGQARKWGVWNAYNRKMTTIKMGDSTATWTYGNATIEQSRADANNFSNVFCGLAECQIECTFLQRLSSLPANSQAKVYIGVDSTSVGSGWSGDAYNATGAGSSTTGMAVARHSIRSILGMSKINTLEQGNGTTSVTYQGTEAGHLLLVTYET